MKKANIFLIAEVQPRSVAQFLLEFLLISAWRCLWKFTYKKSVYLGLLNHLKSTSLCHWLTAFNINHSHKELHLKCFGGSIQVPILSEIAVLVETARMARWYESSHSKVFIFSESISVIQKFRSSHQNVFVSKGVLKICSKFTGEHPCQSAISISNRTSAWVFTCKIAACFQNTFS